jgi:hypothetical protein
MRLHHIARITMIVPELESAIAEHRQETPAQVTRLNVPEARAMGLGVAAIAGARAALIAPSDAVVQFELIELRDARPASRRLGWAGFALKQKSLSVLVHCADSAVSAAFYLGLGANAAQQMDARTRAIQLHDSELRFESREAHAPALDLGNLSCGILSVQLARVGSRGQAGPLRLLRGPDAELIELV